MAHICWVENYVFSNRFAVKFEFPSMAILLVGVLGDNCFAPADGKPDFYCMGFVEPGLMFEF